MFAKRNKIDAEKSSVKGMKRNVSYSKIKWSKASKVKYLKASINKKIRQKADEGALKQRRDYCQANIDNLDVLELKNECKEA